MGRKEEWGMVADGRDTGRNRNSSFFEFSAVEELLERGKNTGGSKY